MTAAHGSSDGSCKVQGLHLRVEHGVHLPAPHVRAATLHLVPTLHLPTPHVRAAMPAKPCAVQFHSHGGQFNFVWLSARTMHPMGRTCGELTKSRRLPTRNPLPLFFVNRYVQLLRQRDVKTVHPGSWASLGGKPKDGSETPEVSTTAGAVRPRVCGGGGGSPPGIVRFRARTTGPHEGVCTLRGSERTRLGRHSRLLHGLCYLARRRRGRSRTLAVRSARSSPGSTGTSRPCWCGASSPWSWALSSPSSSRQVSASRRRGERPVPNSSHSARRQGSETPSVYR